MNIVELFLKEINDNANIVNANIVIHSLLGPIFTAILGVFAERMKQEPKKTKRLKWISSCLSKNEVIIDILKEYREISGNYYKGSQQNPKPILLIFLFTFFGALLFVAIYSFFHKEPDTHLLWLFMNVITLIFFEYAFKRVDVMISNMENGKSPFSEYIMKKKFYNHQLLVFLLILSLAFAIFYVGSLWESKQSFNIIYFVLFNGVVLYVYVSKLANLNDRFKSTLNIYLYQKYMEHLPIVHITIEYNTYFGKVCDIFDDNMIVLENHGEIISSEWGQIISMKCEV